MLTIEAPTADAAWRQLAHHLKSQGRVQESRDQPIRELLHVAFSISDPRQRLVFARPINPAFAIAEVIWILAGFNDIEWLSWWNPRIVKLAADEGCPALHGAYGYRLGSQPRIDDGVAHALRHEMGMGGTRLDQLRASLEALRHDPTSRQVVLQIWDASQDLPDPHPRSRDIPCNVASHLLVRDDRLEWLQVMRSNDIIWGLPYNIIQFTTLHEIMAGWLGVEVGSYNQVSDSLHVYERHWQELDAADSSPAPVPQNKADLRVGSYEEWEALWARMVECTGELTLRSTPEDLLAVLARFADVPPGYAEWLALLTAEALRRRGFASDAEAVIPKAGPWWEASWRQWTAARRADRAMIAQQPLDALEATADDEGDHLGIG